MIKRKSTKNGYTLLELLIVTGVVALAAASVYGIAKVASDWSKSSRETEKLQILFRQIDDSTSMVGSYSGIDKDNLVNISSGISSVLGLDKIESPSPKKLNFEYKNLSARVCRDLTGKMLSSSSAVDVIVNDSNFSKSQNLANLVAACDNSDNTVTIVLNKFQDDFTTASVTPSVNVPGTPPALPVNGPYVSPPIIGNPYVTSTANPIRYALADFPPNSTPMPPPTPPGVYQPPSIPPTGPTIPPFTPPVVTAPPATPNGGNAGSGSGTSDSWQCPSTACSVILYVENDGANTYFGLTMFPASPGEAAKSWKTGNLGDSIEDKEVIVNPTVIRSNNDQIYLNAGWNQSFYEYSYYNYSVLRNAIVQYGVGDANIGYLGLDNFMGSEIIASNGARFQIGAQERSMSSSSVYGPGYTGRINVYFMRRI